MAQRNARETWGTSSLWLRRAARAAMWCTAAVGLSGSSPTGPVSLSEALRPVMAVMVVGVIIIGVVVMLAAYALISFWRGAQEGQAGTTFGQAGRSTYIMSLKWMVLGFGGLVLFAVVFIVFPGIFGRSSTQWVMLTLMVVAVVAFKLLAKRSDQAERGADAEVVVAGLLGDLPKEYRVFHDLVFEGFNIDHVVIGSTGVFTVETKSHRGQVSARGETLLLNGRPFAKPVLNQAWSEAYALRDRLPTVAGEPCPIQPILCFPNAFIEVRGPVKGVIVVSRNFLRRVITGRRVGVLSEDTIVEFVSALKAKALPDSSSGQKA